ncbi:hypothetical protein JL2886_01122 [Phaeobacter gallaeciensis]|uniref:Uncharacterized protein n=1 Tax=Phaeobacter gallaeciensis TaxID=60890 RepID=A0A1B0ZPD5_9RHOB|nr:MULTISPECIES: hypothetical protein [Phaeobacter]ANP36043.1 hypothetical protein JL2886_01122 [Phaeobacter gallaeciensis]MDE4147167.1 hypothetical protein [Phaeobacter gallaeciensis]MDE4159811.1 hypothetical protein [Phaeobacter gallaeciensis]MDE4164026.1 hypothetical protein [Phaeobacter gallaeciensis]MDE4168260.1 hypothetical protein [Phaeobacter gallaeciensis]
MTKLDTEALKLVGVRRKETAMEKTTRAAREILDDENEMRRAKNERLRRSRLQYEHGDR